MTPLILALAAQVRAAFFLQSAKHCRWRIPCHVFCFGRGGKYSRLLERLLLKMTPGTMRLSCRMVFPCLVRQEGQGEPPEHSNHSLTLPASMNGPCCRLGGSKEE